MKAVFRLFLSGLMALSTLPSTAQDSLALKLEESGYQSFTSYRQVVKRPGGETIIIGGGSWVLTQKSPNDVWRKDEARRVAIKNKSYRGTLHFFDNKRCLLVSKRGDVVLSNDGGYTFIKSGLKNEIGRINNNGNAMVEVSPDGKAWIFNPSGIIYYTADFGISWKKVKHFNQQNSNYGRPDDRLAMYDGKTGILSHGKQVFITYDNWKTITLLPDRYKPGHDHPLEVYKVHANKSGFLVSATGNYFYWPHHCKGWQYIESINNVVEPVEAERFVVCSRYDGLKYLDSEGLHPVTNRSIPYFYDGFADDGAYYLYSDDSVRVVRNGAVKAYPMAVAVSALKIVPAGIGLNEYWGKVGYWYIHRESEAHPWHKVLYSYRALRLEKHEDPHKVWRLTSSGNRYVIDKYGNETLHVPNFNFAELKHRRLLHFYAERESRYAIDENGDIKDVWNADSVWRYRYYFADGIPSLDNHHRLVGYGPGRGMYAPADSFAYQDSSRFLLLSEKNLQIRLVDILIRLEAEETEEIPMEKLFTEEELVYVADPRRAIAVDDGGRKLERTDEGIKINRDWLEDNWPNRRAELLLDNGEIIHFKISQRWNSVFVGVRITYKGKTHMFFDRELTELLYQLAPHWVGDPSQLVQDYIKWQDR